MLKRFINFYKPYKKLFTLDMIASFFVSLSAMFYPIITGKMLNDYIPNAKFNMIIIFGLILLGVYIIRALLKYFVQYYGHIMGVYIQNDMRQTLFKKIERFPYSYFDNHETGDILSRVTNDVDTVSQNMNNSLATLVSSIRSPLIFLRDSSTTYPPDSTSSE